MSFRECLAGLALLMQPDSLCRMCYVSSPVVWMFGCFYVAINSFNIYARFPESELAFYVVVLGLFTILCGIFTTSNTIHICLQLPTSHMAAKLQRFAQAFMIVIFTILITLNMVAYLGSWETSKPSEDFEMRYRTFLLQCSVVYMLLGVSSIACFYV